MAKRNTRSQKTLRLQKNAARVSRLILPHLAAPCVRRPNSEPYRPRLAASTDLASCLKACRGLAPLSRSVCEDLCDVIYQGR